MFFRGGGGGNHRTHACIYTFKRALPGTCNCELAHGILGVC